MAQVSLSSSPNLRWAWATPRSPAMYSASYGGFPNAVPGNAGSGPTFDGGAPPAQNTHMQPSQSPNMPQMMYSNQQFPMGAQGQFSGGNPASMMAAAGPTAMMQNPGMPHMTPNGQSKLASLSFSTTCFPSAFPPLHCFPHSLSPRSLSFVSCLPCFACHVCVSDTTSRNDARGRLTPPSGQSSVPGTAPVQARPTFSLATRLLARYRHLGWKLIWVIHSGISDPFHKLPVWRRGASYCSSPTTVPRELHDGRHNASSVPSQWWRHASAADAAADDATHVPAAAERTSDGRVHAAASVQPSAGHSWAVDTISAGAVCRAA